MHIVVHNAMAAIDTEQWNAMVDDNNPFMRHEFLHGLEDSGCVSEANGWQPQHIAVYESTAQATLLGAMPCYIKTHSYGEYIFDWAWADAHLRHGFEYYPKLSNAVPFTPATGPRWIYNRSTDEEVCKALITEALKLVKDKGLSSFHSLFLTENQAALAQQLGLSKRLSTQFHWHNNGYRNFEEFLAKMTSKKRKNINRERRRVRESEVSYRWLRGEQLDETAIATMTQFYLRTIRYYGAQAYLNKEFFEYLAKHLADQTLFLFAEYDKQVIAGGLYFCSDNTLYGRYWGALNNFHSIHFETCYYQAIEWCINNGYQRFEAGAQGEHKLARGLEPATTYSAHWITDPQFRNAIDDFLEQEESHINRYQGALSSHSPFRKEL